MLSYLHGFHAGNHADVLKHAVYLHLLEHLAKKPKPFTCIDTHAGVGHYDLREARADRNREHEQGVTRLWTCGELPPLLDRYRSVVRDHDANHRAGDDDDGSLRYYPGSPTFAERLLRPSDPLHLYELHPREQDALTSVAAQRSRRRTHVHRADGPAALPGLLPPPSRRGLVLIDPPYERGEEYEEIPRALGRSLERFATGTYLLWYPVVERAQVDALVRSVGERAAGAGIETALRAELRIAADHPGRGMTGSGVIVLNPAWTLHEALVDALPVLVDLLSADGGGHTVERL